MAEVRSHDVSLPRPRVASTEPTLEVPRLNDVGNHFTNHTATRNRENNKTPNKYPVTRKSSDLLGQHRKIGELSSAIPPYGQVAGPPGTTSFSIPPYRDESATQRRIPAYPSSSGGAPPLRREANAAPSTTTTTTISTTSTSNATSPKHHQQRDDDPTSTVHLHRVDEMHHNASPEPKERGSVDAPPLPSQVRRPVSRPSSLLDRGRGNANTATTIQSPPGGASSVGPPQEFLGRTRSRSPVAVYSDPVPTNEGSEPTLSFDVHSTSLSPNPLHRDDAVTQTPNVGVDEGTTTTDLPLPSPPTINRSPSNPDNLPSQQDADEYLCSSSADSSVVEEEEEDGAYYPHTTQDLQEELRRLRAEMAAEGEVLEGLKAEEVTAKSACDDPTPQQQQPSTDPTPEYALAKLRDDISDSNDKEAQLRATLLEMNISAQNAQARRHHYNTERGRVGDSIYEEVSSIKIDAEMAQDQQQVDGNEGGLEAHRAVGTLIHHKNIASEALEEASHNLATSSGDMPTLNAASRDARTRYVEEVSTATKRAAAERADLEAKEEESERLRRDEAERLQQRAREFVRVSATADINTKASKPNTSSVNSFSRDDSLKQQSHSPQQGRSPLSKPGYTTTVKPTISKRDLTAKGVEGVRPTTSSSANNVTKAAPSANTSRTTSLAAKSVGSTTSTIPLDKRKPFVVPNKRPPSQSRNPSPSLPPRSNTPQAIPRDVGGFGVRSGRRPTSPQAAPPQQQQQQQRWGGGGGGSNSGGVRGVLSDDPPVAFRRLMTPPSVSSRVSIPQQRHLHMEAPPHPSNMAAAQRPTSFYY